MLVHKCNKCARKFETIRGVKQHLFRAHGSKRKTQFTSLVVAAPSKKLPKSKTAAKYKCKYCGKAFLTIPDIANHIRWKHIKAKKKSLSKSKSSPSIAMLDSIGSTQVLKIPVVLRVSINTKVLEILSQE